MRKALVALALTALALGLVAQAGAVTTQKFDALVRGEFPGASPESCPTDPSLFTCEVGHISGYGKVTQVFTFEGDRRVGDCVEITGTVLWTLIDDRSSTLATREVIVDCTPGGSAAAPGNRLHSFGNPFEGEGTYVITGGTGVFRDASGSGTVHTRSGGDALVIRYDGIITLP